MRRNPATFWLVLMGLSFLAAAGLQLLRMPI